MHCAAEQLHAVLHLPHAHSLHHHGVCCLGPRPQIQQKQRWHHLQVSPFLYLAFTLSSCCHLALVSCCLLCVQLSLFTAQFQCIAAACKSDQRQHQNMLPLVTGLLSPSCRLLTRSPCHGDHSLCILLEKCICMQPWKECLQACYLLGHRLCPSMTTFWILEEVACRYPSDTSAMHLPFGCTQNGTYAPIPVLMSGPFDFDPLDNSSGSNSSHA